MYKVNKKVGGPNRSRMSRHDQARVEAQIGRPGTAHRQAQYPMVHGRIGLDIWA